MYAGCLRSAVPISGIPALSNCTQLRDVIPMTVMSTFDRESHFLNLRVLSDIENPVIMKIILVSVDGLWPRDSNSSEHLEVQSSC